MGTVFENIQNWFESYVRGYYSEDEFIQRNIILKEHHTYRVVSEADGLADYLGFGPKEKPVVSIMALFHDIARFPQITRYRSFRDRVTRDHGDWGYDIILREGILEGLPEDDRAVILTAVRLHNKYVLPEGLDEKTLMYCRLLRDADKIDIFHVITSMEDMTEDGLGADPRPAIDGEFNPVLVGHLLHNRNADYRDVFSTTDMYLLQLSWIFSLNFPYTLDRINNCGHIEKLMDKLPEKEIFREVKQHIRRYLEIFLSPAR